MCACVAEHGAGLTHSFSQRKHVQIHRDWRLRVKGSCSFISCLQVCPVSAGAFLHPWGVRWAENKSKSVGELYMPVYCATKSWWGCAEALIVCFDATILAPKCGSMVTWAPRFNKYCVLPVVWIGFVRLATPSKPNTCECIWHNDECVGWVGVGELYEYAAMESKPLPSSETPQVFKVWREM